MFYDPNSNTNSVATFIPAINTKSYQMMGNVDPIEKRASEVTAARDAKVADLAHNLQLQRRQTETFRPKINPTSDQLAQAAAQRRVPLGERTNAQAEREQLMLDKLNQAPPPVKSVMDPNSRKILLEHNRGNHNNNNYNFTDESHQQNHDGAIHNPHHHHQQQQQQHAQEGDEALFLSSSHIHQQQQVKRKVRQLWTDYAEANTMSAIALRKVLINVGLDGSNDVLWVKFLVALGVKSVMHGNNVVSPVPSNGKKHHDDIEYDKFLRVFTALLNSASSTKEIATNTTAATPRLQQKEQQPRKHQDLMNSNNSNTRTNVATEKPSTARNDLQHQQTNTISQQHEQRKRASSVPMQSIVPVQKQPQNQNQGNTNHHSNVVANQNEKTVMHQEEQRKTTTSRQDHHHHQQQSPQYQPSSSATVDDWMGTSSSQLQQQNCQNNINNKKNIFSLPQPAGVDEAIKRMQSAREKKKFKFEESLRGEGEKASSANNHEDECLVNNNNNNINTRKNISTPFHSHSQERAEQKEKEKPLLHIEVNLSGGKKGKISVHHGDTAQSLSRQFAVSHSLNDAPLLAKLERLVQTEMDRFFTSEEGRKLLRKIMVQEHQRRQQERAASVSSFSPIKNGNYDNNNTTSKNNNGAGYASKMMSSSSHNRNSEQQQQQQGLEISPSKKRNGTWEFSL